MLSRGDPTRSDVEQIRAAGERAVTLARELLRVPGAAPDPQPAAVDLQSLIVDALPALRRIAGDRIDVSTEAIGECRIIADPADLSHRIAMLVLKARDAMPEGGGVTISAAVGDPVEIVVATTAGWVSPERIALPAAKVVAERARAAAV